MLKKLLFLILFCFSLNTLAVNQEKIVLVSGVDFKRTGQCWIKDCSDTEYLYKDLGSYLNAELDNNRKLADIYSFKWSRDVVSHGENLKKKFAKWFNSTVCPSQNCNVSFIAHSWGTVITTDFISSLPSNIKIRTVVTYGSPVTGIQTNYGQQAFWKTAINNVFASNNNIDGQAARWMNIVHPNDPFAWDYIDEDAWIWGSDVDKVENVKPNGKLSTKGALKEAFPLDDLGLKPLDIGLGLIDSKFKVGEELLKSLMKNWSPDLLLNFNRHSTPNYEPKRLVQYVTDRLPIVDEVISTNSSPQEPAIQYIEQCLTKLNGYFGSGNGAAFPCGNEQFYCQLTTGGRLANIQAIAIPKQLTPAYLYFYYQDKWYTTNLSLCD